jgi:error-prone DNA polymerase
VAEAGIRLVVGSRLDLRDGLPVLAYPTDRATYSRPCRLTTLGKARTGKGGCDLAWADLVGHGESLPVVLIPDAADDAMAGELRRLAAGFPGRCYLQLGLRHRPDDASRLPVLSEMAVAACVPMVVIWDVLYHLPARRILQHIVTRGARLDRDTVSISISGASAGGRCSPLSLGIAEAGRSPTAATPRDRAEFMSPPATSHG